MGEQEEQEVIEEGEASAGEPQEAPEGELAALPPISANALDERQKQFRETRRHGGPDLNAETRARDEAQETVPDVEPTETDEEAPDESSAT
jgi:hypothetical protein